MSNINSSVIPLLLLMFVLNIFLGTAIFFRGGRNRINLLFASISLFVGLWSVSIVGFYSEIGIENINWAVFSHVFALAVSLVFFLFAASFPSTLIKNKIYYIFIIFPFLAVTLLLLFTDEIIDKTINFTYSMNELYVLYALLITTYFTSGYIFLFVQYKKTDDDVIRDQIKLILGGSMVASSLGTIADMFLPLWGSYNYLWLGPLFTIFLVVPIAIAILKYRLFNLKVVFVEFFIVLFNIFLFINMFLSHGTNSLFLNVTIFVGILMFSFLLLRSIYRDIHDRQKIEALAFDVGVVNKRLHAMERSKTEFVSIASHQLRTPLTVIKGYASMILEGTFGPVGEGARNAMSNLFQSSERVVGLVEELLTVSRIEQGRMMLQFKPVDFYKFTEEMISEVEWRIKEAGLNLVLTIGKAPTPWVSMDDKKFKQAIFHILDNAIKYNVSNGSIDVEVQNDKTTKKARLIITNTGLGIDSDEMMVLVEKFDLSSSDGETVDIENGQKQPQSEEHKVRSAEMQRMLEQKTGGIGLYIAKRIVEAHQGTIKITSEGKGTGTKVVIEIPLTSDSVVL